MLKQMLLVACLCATPSLMAADSGPSAIDTVLNDWHQAAAAADESRYFGHFAPEAIFLGTDATERWDVTQFSAFAKPYFDRKKTWDFTPKQRHVSFSADGTTAWFDELLDTKNLGLCRGSGVLVKQDGQWKIAQYNLSIPIPNELANEVVAKIAHPGK